MKRAEVLVVTGPCATGKTTLVRRLAPLLGRPLLAKDDFKEILYDALGPFAVPGVGGAPDRVAPAAAGAPDRDTSRRLGVAAFELIWHLSGQLAAAGADHIIEYPATQGDFLAAGLRRLTAAYGARIALLELSASPAAIIARIERRAADGSRHPSHHDLTLLDELSRPVVPYGCLAGAGRYRLIRTDDFAAFDAGEIAAWVRET